MTRQYFGTDGIRGTVGQAPITPDFALCLGHAVGQPQDRRIGQRLGIGVQHPPGAPGGKLVHQHRISDGQQEGGELQHPANMAKARP